MRFFAAACLALAPVAFAFPGVEHIRQAGPPAVTTPNPVFQHLYTAYADCLNAIYTDHGPNGIRIVYPTTGGNFSGPLLSGKFGNFGGDWGIIDPQTDVFFSNTRSDLTTDDGANIYVQTAGPQVSPPLGQIHVRVTLETGSKKYYWLNNAVVVGILQPVAADAKGFTLRLDTYYLASSNGTTTTFVNGTTYGIGV